MLEADVAARYNERPRVRTIDDGVRTSERVDAILHRADVLEQRRHLPHHPVRNAVEPQRHGGRGGDRADADLSLRPQPQDNPGRARDERDGQRVIDDLEAGDEAHLRIHGQQEFLHRGTGEAGFAPRVREQLDGGDVGVGVGDAAGHHRARVGLGARHPAQPRHEIGERRDVQRDPADERREQPQVEAAQHGQHRREIDDHEHEELGDDDPHVAHRERRLHHLGGDAAGELVLVEPHALRQHQPVEVPAQQHREIARQRLLLDRGLQRHDADAGDQHAAQQQQRGALLDPQAGRLDRREPVDDVPHHAEQQRLERADGGGEQRHRQQVFAQPARAGPDEREEPPRRNRRGCVGIGIDQSFEPGKQGKAPRSAQARHIAFIGRVQSNAMFRFAGGVRYHGNGSGRAVEGHDQPAWVRRRRRGTTWAMK